MKEATEKDRTYFINTLREKLEQKEQQVRNYSNKIFELGERLILLNWIVHNINAALEIIPLSKFVCTEIKKIIESDFCAILIYNYETQMFDIIKKEQSHTNKIFNKIFKEDLQKYNLFLKKFIQKRPQNIREKIEAYVKEFDANKYVYMNILLR